MTHRSNLGNNWREGKPSVTSTRMTKYFERRKQSKSVVGQTTSGGGPNTMSNRRHNSTQRQIKGLYNLGDIKSSQLDGIKISRLNGLGQQEDSTGNPLATINRLQMEMEARASE